MPVTATIVALSGAREVIQRRLLQRQLLVERRRALQGADGVGLGGDAAPDEADRDGEQRQDTLVLGDGARLSPQLPLRRGLAPRADVHLVEPVARADDLRAAARTRLARAAAGVHMGPDLRSELGR